MLKQKDSGLLDSVRPTSQELRNLSIDFAAGYQHPKIMCFYEKLPAEYAGGCIRVEVDPSLDSSTALTSCRSLINNRQYVKVWV